MYHHRTKQCFEYKRVEIHSWFSVEAAIKVTVAVIPDTTGVSATSPVIILTDNAFTFTEASETFTITDASTNRGDCALRNVIVAEPTLIP